MNPATPSINRRHFITGAATMAAALTAPVLSAQTTPGAAPAKFNLRFAPHPGTFKTLAGNDVTAQIRFAFEQGFTAWEDNGMPKRPVAEQEKIGATLKELGMAMGVFVGYGNFDSPVFTRANHPGREDVLKSIRESVAICKRVGAKFFTVVPGSIDQQQKDDKWNNYGGPRLPEGVQTANAIELLRECCAILEPEGLVMVLEPLNWETNHGGVFLRSTDQAFALCKAVDSPSCKILYDMYHEQITSGDIINTMNRCWSEIAYLQCGDNPGRKEPGTGEMNYSNIFRHVAGKSKDLIIGMEHGNSAPGKAGEQKTIDAYRTANPAA